MTESHAPSVLLYLCINLIFQHIVLQFSGQRKILTTNDLVFSLYRIGETKTHTVQEAISIQLP